MPQDVVLVLFSCKLWSQDTSIFKFLTEKMDQSITFTFFSQIRKQAIKDLPTLCRMCPEHTAQIAEALSQLLVSDDATELSVIQSSLISLFTINAKGNHYFTQPFIQYKESIIFSQWVCVCLCVLPRIPVR